MAPNHAEPTSASTRHPQTHRPRKASKAPKLRPPPHRMQSPSPARTATTSPHSDHAAPTPQRTHSKVHLQESPEKRQRPAPSIAHPAHARTTPCPASLHPQKARHRTQPTPTFQHSNRAAPTPERTQTTTDPPVRQRDSPWKPQRPARLIGHPAPAGRTSRLASLRPLSLPRQVQSPAQQTARSKPAGTTTPTRLPTTQNRGQEAETARCRRGCRPWHLKARLQPTAQRWNQAASSLGRARATTGSEVRLQGSPE